MSANGELSQQSTPEISIHGSSQWSPVTGQVDSARVSEAPLENDFDRSDQFDTSNFPGSPQRLGRGHYNMLPDMQGHFSDFLPLALPLDESSASHSRFTDISANSQDTQSSPQPHKPIAMCARSNIAQRRQNSGISLSTPADSETPEQFPWMQGDDLQLGLTSYFNGPEEISGNLNLDGFPPLWS